MKTMLKGCVEILTIMRLTISFPEGLHSRDLIEVTFKKTGGTTIMGFLVFLIKIYIKIEIANIKQLSVFGIVNDMNTYFVNSYLSMKIRTN